MSCSVVVAQVESLESRRVLSASPFSGMPPGMFPIGMGQAQQQQAKQAAEYQAQVNRSIAVGKAHGIKPSILGRWTGRAEGGVLFVKEKYDITLDIQQVKPNFARGTLTIDGKEYSGRIPGKTKPTHEFTYTFARGGDKVTVDGLLNGLNTAAKGTISAKYDGWNIKGAFSVVKVKPATA